ncbi:MAG: enoyl-CoA hydratase/isomerase family protein [Janthinobacterium lividum]
MTDELLFEVRDGIARVTFNRPQARNALTFAMYERLAEVCAQVDEDRGVRAMVLTGAGDKAFAAGTDIAQFRAFGSAEDALVYEARIDRVLGALERCRVPTIAAIAGACTGGGCAIASVCDLRVAARGARLGFPVARTLGNCLSVSSLARLSALIGPARVKDIVFTARLLDADEALAAGLVGEVVADPAALAERTDALAALVASHAPLTMLATKEGLRRLRDGGPGADGADLVAMCYTSADFREGMEAFLAKRPAQWTGT